jgi:hypothetical protein
MPRRSPHYGKNPFQNALLAQTGFLFLDSVSSVSYIPRCSPIPLALGAQGKMAYFAYQFAYLGLPERRLTGDYR